MANGFDPRSQFYKAQASQVAQKRQALTYARQRQDAEERTKIQNVNTLSGFQASQIPEGPMREIYEDRIRDAQAYMNGAGSYEGQEYSALEAANKISGLTTMFNKMSAHNMGDVAEAQAAYKKGAFEVAEDRERINPYGDPSGEAVYANNSPDGYRARVQKHNNYFQWTGEYDANGDPLGYMIGDDGQLTGEPMSIFEMQGYANPSSFESDTVKEPIPALVDVVSDPKLQRRMSTIAALQSTQDILKEKNIANDAALSHQEIASMVIRDYMGTSKEDMEFRESIVREMQNRGFELKDHQIQAFINSPTSADPTALGDIQQKAAEILSDLTYNAPTIASSPFEGKFEVQGRGGSIADAPYMVEVDRLKEPVEISGGENLPGTSNSYTINGVGFDQTNGDILIPITYTEAEELDDELRSIDGIEARTFTTNKTLRIPAGKLDQADPLALEAYRNLPQAEQDKINSQIATSRVESDEDIARELEAQQAQTQSVQGEQTAAAPAAATTASTAATTASQPQQEEALDIQEMEPAEENFEDPVEDVGGAQLTPLAALPTRDVSLIEQANEALRDPVMSTSPNYGPAARAAEETLRDPQATDRSRERAVSTLQEIVNQRDRVAEGPERRERAAFESDAEGVDPQVLEQYYNNVEPRAYGLYPLPEGATISGSDVVRVNDQVVGRYESRLNPNTGQYVTGMRPMAVEPQSDFSRQVGESVSDASSAASNLAAGIRDNAGSNLRRAYDAARETLGGAGSAFLNFITGATSGIEEAGAGARPPAPRPSGSTFVPPSPTSTITTPEAVADPSRAPEAADVVSERERLQNILDSESSLMPESVQREFGLIEEEPSPTIEDSAILQLPEDLESMDLVAKHEGYASASPRAKRANIPLNNKGKPHSNSGYTIGGLDIYEHTLDGLPVLKDILKPEDYTLIKSLEGLKGSEAQKKLREIKTANPNFDPSLSYISVDDIKRIELETFEEKIKPGLETKMTDNGTTYSAYEDLPLKVRQAMNSVFFLSPPKASPQTSKLLANAIKSNTTEDWKAIIKELDRFWDKPNNTQETRVGKSGNDGIMQGHIDRMQENAKAIADEYNISYTPSKKKGDNIF